MEPIHSYRDLNVWKLGMDLSERAYLLTKNFPTDERFGLTSQIRRAATSIPANIAEGHARDSTKDFLRFISIAMGSLAELETHLLLAVRLKYFSQSQLSEIEKDLASLGRQLRGLQRALDRKLEK